jgi:hypothetical protein
LARTGLSSPSYTDRIISGGSALRDHTKYAVSCADHPNRKDRSSCRPI